MGEVVGSGSVYASSGSTSKMYAKSSSGGDPVTDSRRGVSGGPGNSYTITVSPSFTLHATTSNNFDLRKMAKDVATLLEEEVKLTMMRTV